jgi:hypothetical protein
VPLASDFVSAEIHPVSDTIPLLEFPSLDDNDETQTESDVDSDNGLVDTGIGKDSTFYERMDGHIQTLHNFCDGLEYQLQFSDTRMLAQLERDGASFFRLAEACLSRERQLNLTRGEGPTTWERTTTSAMYYRMRPSRGDANS